MSKIDIARSTEVKNGDMMAIMSVHGELEGLLSLICEDDFRGFRRLSAKQQFSMLVLARTLAVETGELFGTCLTSQAIRQAKQAAQKVEEMA